MMCAWKPLLSILPKPLRDDVDKLGSEQLQAIRMRINAPPELVTGGKSIWLKKSITREDLHFVVNTASRYSAWAADTVTQGYLTAPGGHRIGICGKTALREKEICAVRDITALCIRIARDFPGIASGVPEKAGSILIIGAPGWGKTTLLRDLIRQISRCYAISVVDERGELFPDGFICGERTDILTGCPKTIGIEMLLRTMGPQYIAVDEITAEEDCSAIIQAANCGVHFLATAHAGSLEDFLKRNLYKELIAHNIFQLLLILREDKSYTMERIAV